MNKNIFNTRHNLSPNTRNNAGGEAFTRSAEEALAQFACTGTFGDTFYVKAENQLEEVKNILPLVSDSFLAKLTVYSIQSAGMKDMSAFLLASLLGRNVPLFKSVANRVLVNGKAVRNFVQVLRSGVLGGKTIPRPARKVLNEWLNNRSVRNLLNDSVGNSPSIADVIKMVHPKPKDEDRKNLFGFLIGKNDGLSIPEVRALRDFQEGRTNDVPNVEFRLLTGKALSTKTWTSIALQLPLRALLMNLNTLGRHGVFSSISVTKEICQKIMNEKAVRESKIFPHTIMMAWKSLDPSIPQEVSVAVQKALNYSLGNVPESDTMIIGVDVSGSMNSPVTGYRGSSTSSVRCVDVAALMASALLFKNPSSKVIPFHTHDCSSQVSLNPLDSVATNTSKLAAINGGGTAISVPFKTANSKNLKSDIFVVISDNESWFTPTTQAMREWEIFKKNNPKAKLFLIDITPKSMTSLQGRDIFPIGGFSDAVFTYMSTVTSSRKSWVNLINEVVI